MLMRYCSLLKGDLSEHHGTWGHQRDDRELHAAKKSEVWDLVSCRV